MEPVQTHMAINYAALDKYESPKAKARWLKMFAEKKPSYGKRVGIAIGVIVLIGIGLMVGFALLQQFAVILVALLFIGVIAYVIRRSRQLKQAAAAFAKDNGWQVMAQQPAFRINSITPDGADTTAGPVGPVITGALDGCNFWLYQYRITTQRRVQDAQGMQQNQQQIIEYHVLSVQLPAQLPMFLLDAKADGRQEKRNGLFTQNLQRVSLEGNFDDYFSLCQQPGTQVDVLSIITPEFMQALMTSGAFLNIEADGQYIHFISSYGNLLNSTPTRYLIEQSRSVVARILFKLGTYQAAVSPAAQPFTSGVSSVN